MPYDDQSLNTRFSNIRQYLYNARNTPDLAALLSPRSYNDEKLVEGEQLLENCEALDSKKDLEYAESFAATDEYNLAWNGILDDFKDLRDLGKVRMKNDRHGYTTMLLHVPLKTNRPGLEDQIRDTLRNTLEKPDVIEKIAPLGLPQTFLEDLLARLDGLKELKRARKDEKKEAQNATYDRDQAIIILEDWMDDFIRVARVATKRKPELMELLGDTVSSS